MFLIKSLVFPMAGKSRGRTTGAFAMLPDVPFGEPRIAYKTKRSTLVGRRRENLDKSRRSAKETVKFV